MTDMIKLTAEPRTVKGKKVKQLRAQDLIPAVIYGQKVDGAVEIQIPRDVLRLTLRESGATNLIEITVAGKSYSVLVREVQRDVMRGDALHVDFYSVDLDVRLSAEVPVVTVGESPIVASGEVMLITPNTLVTIEALPANIPSEIPLDISLLADPSDLLTAGDLVLPEGVDLVTDADLVLARTEMPREFVEETTGEEEGFFDDSGAEPEVISRAKDEEIED